MIIPPFWGRKPTGGVGDLPVSSADPLGESIVGCVLLVEVSKDRVDDRVEVL